MKHVYDDGGRAAAGYKGHTGDCFVRACAIVTGKPYQEIYDLVNVLAERERLTHKRPKRSNARTGVHTKTAHRVMYVYGFRWFSTMGIGTGCKVHLVDGEIPSDRPLICRLSRHYTAVVGGVIHDTYDPQRDVHCIEPDYGQGLKSGQWRNENGICSISRRCVYGYWQEEHRSPWR